MLTSEMREGNRISIIVDKLEFESEIQIIKEEYILITVIVVDDLIVKFPPGVKVSLVYYGDNNKLFIWEDINITPVKYKDGNKYHKIDMPEEEGKRYNRRENYRLYIGKEMAVDVRMGTELQKLNVMIKDISASGYAFLSKEDYNIGNKADLHYIINRDKKFLVPAKIVRKQYMENIAANIYGCQFSQESDELRKIINEEQQKNRQEKET